MQGQFINGPGGADRHTAKLTENRASRLITLTDAATFNSNSQLEDNIRLA